MEKQSQYITELYGQLVSIDPSYKKDVPFESFQKNVSSNPSYRKSLYNQLVSLDPTYKDDVSFESFEVSIIGSPEKKKESASALPSQDLGQSPVSGEQQGTVSAPTTKAPTQPQQPVAKGPVQQTPITGTIGLPEFVTETPAEKPLQPGQGVLAQPKQQPTKQPVQTTGQVPTPQQQAPKFGEEFTRRILEAPTEESLYSYLTTINPNRYKFKTEGPLGADPTAISTAYSERTPEQLRGFLKETVFELNKIKSSDMSNDVKALMAKDLIRKKLVKYGEPIGETKPITDDLIISEAAVRNSNPRGFNQVIDERIKSQAIDTPIVEGWSKSDPFGSYKNKMISQAFSSSYGTNLNDPMAKEAFLVTRLERLKNADPSVLNSPDHKERIKKFETEIDLLRKERIESFRTKIEEANAKLEEIESLGNYDSAALAQARKELKLAEDELDGYLNPDKAAVVVYSSNPTISLEAGETPMDKMKNHLARLVHERNEIRSQISTGENIAGFILPNNERQKRLAELESQIKTLTPVVLLNTGPRTSNVEEGSFFDAAIRSMTKTVAPGGLFSDLPVSQQEGAQNILGAMVQSGIDLSVYNPDKLNDLKERTKGYGLGDSRYWGELLGGTAGYLLPGFVGGALTQPFKIEKAIKGTKFLGRLTNIAADAVDSGAAYMVGGTLLPRYEDMTFVSGALGGAFGNVGKNILPLIPFLNKEGKNFLVNRIAAGIAETGEEFGNTIGETWKQYGMDGFWEGMKEKFPNADETFKFVISTFALGTVMGSGTEAGRAFMRQAQEEFENATPEQQRAMQPAIDEIFDESVAIQQAGSDDLKNQSSAKGAEQQVTPAAEVVAPVAEEVTPAVEEAAPVTAAEEVAPIKYDVTNVNGVDVINTGNNYIDGWEEYRTPVSNLSDNDFIEGKIMDLEYELEDALNTIKRREEEIKEDKSKSTFFNSRKYKIRYSERSIERNKNEIAKINEAISFFEYHKNKNQGVPKIGVATSVEEATPVTAAEEVSPIAEPVAPVVEAAPVVTPEAQGELDALTQRADEITAILREDNATKQATGKGQLTRTERDKLVNEVSDINRQIQEAQKTQAPVTPPAQMAPTAPIEVAPLNLEDLDLGGDLASQLEQQITPQEVQRDQEDIQRLPGEERVGQEPVQAEPIEGAGREAAPTGGILQTQKEVTAKAYDFDDTLYNPRTKKLTPLGEQVKARIEAGEDIKVVTARGAKDTAEIKSALGISDNNIHATGDEAKKGEVLDQLGINRNDYYDADTAKMEAIQSKQEAVAPVVQVEAPKIEVAPKMEAAPKVEAKPVMEAAPVSEFDRVEFQIGGEGDFLEGTVLETKKDFATGQDKVLVETEVDGKKERMYVFKKDTKPVVSASEKMAIAAETKKPMPKDVAELYAKRATLRLTLDALKSQMGGAQLKGKSKQEYDKVKSEFDSIEDKINDYESSLEVEPKLPSEQKTPVVQKAEEAAPSVDSDYGNFLLDEIDKKHRAKYNGEDIKTGLAKQFNGWMKDKGERRAVSMLEDVYMNYVPNNVRAETYSVLRESFKKQQKSAETKPVSKQVQAEAKPAPKVEAAVVTIAEKPKDAVEVTNKSNPKVSPESTLSSVGMTEEDYNQWQKKNKKSLRSKPIKEIQDAVRKLLEGAINFTDYLPIARRLMKSQVSESLPNPDSLKDVAGSLDGGKLENGVIGANKFIKPGTKVGLRLNIPSFNSYGKKVVTVHPAGKDSVIGYGNVASAKNVTFETSVSTSSGIASGRTSKMAFAKAEGEWIGETQESLMARAEEAMKSPEWVQVGMNPYKHSFFFDKADGNPVVSADEVIQIGGFVLAKNPVKIDLSTEEGLNKFRDEFTAKTKDGVKYQFRKGDVGEAKTSQERAAQRVQRVRDFFKDSGIEVVEVTPKEMSVIVGKDKDGKKIGGVFISSEGKVYLNTEQVGAVDSIGDIVAFHEAIHPVINAVRQTNPKAYAALVDAINKEAKKNPQVAKAVEDIKREYEGESKETIEDETVVEVLARIASGDIDPINVDRTLRDKLIDFMNKVANMLGLPNIAKTSSASEFKKFSDKLSKALTTAEGNIFDVIDRESIRSIEEAKPQFSQQAEEKRQRPVKVATMFSGAGTMEAALTGTESVMAVEYNPEYMKAYNEAFGLDYKPKDVNTVSPQEVIDAKPDIFHASPVCKNFSAAKSKKTVEKTDMDSANAVARVITEAKPPVVTIENVPQYEGTVPFQTIIDALEKAGYTFDVDVYNAADFGGVQNRKRLLIRAVKDGELPPVPQKQKQGDWYDAVKDLIDAAPDAPFKSRTGEENWEQQRVKEMVKQGKLDPTKPIITMGGSAFKGEASASNAGNPSPTLKSTSKEVPRIIMPDGRVKRVTPEMMKRIMGLPDSYALPENSKVAKEVLGNGIDGAFTKALIQPLVDRQVATEEAGKVSPQSEVKAALDKMKNAWADWLGGGMGAMSDPKEEARKLAAAIDATLNLGAELIKFGVTDLAEWSKQVKDIVKGTGSTWMDTVSDAFVEKMYNESKKRAEQGVKPTQEQAKETEEEKAPEGQKVRKAYKSAKEKGGIDIDEVLAEQDKFYPPRKIADVTEYAKQFIKEKGTQGVIEYLRSGTTDFDTAVIAGKELLKYWHNKANTTADPKAKAEALKNAADVASELFQLGTRLGQGVNAYKGYSEGMMLFGPEFMIKFATKRVAEVRKKILGRTEKIDEAAAESINEGTDDAKNIAINSNSVTNAIDEAINESKPETILGLTKEQIKARQAKALAKARAAFKGGELLTGADIRPVLDAVAAVAEYGFYLVAEGVVNFKTWSSRIKKEIPNITDDILQKAWQTEYEGITPEMMAAKMSATDKLSGIMADKKDKASDPLRQVADIVRKKIKGRTKSEPKSPAAQLAEAVTNAERYADAWNTARAEVINKIQNGTGTDAEKQSKIDALNKALDEAIGQPFSESLVKKAIKKEMEARNQTMKDVLKDYDLAKMTADEVAKKIAEDTGLAEDQAKKVADAVKKEFDNNIKKARRAALLRNLGTEGKIYFDFVDKVGEKISPDEWNKYLAEKYKLPTLDEKTIQQLNDIAEEARSLPEGSYVQSKTGAEAMKILANINGIDKAGLFWDLHYAKMLGSFKTHARNIIGNFYNAVTEIGITGIEQLIRNGDFFAGFNSAMGFLNAAATMGQLMSREVAATGVVVKGSKFEAPGTIESIRKGQNIFKWAGTPGQKATQMLTFAKYVGRALAAEDAFFFQASRGMRIREVIREEVIKNNKLLGLKKSQKQIWKEVNDILYGTKAEQAAAKRTVEFEAQKFGYTKREKALRYYEIMEERIPSKVKGEGERVGAFISYNYQPVGILGGLSEMISNFKAKNSRNKLLNLIIPFTRVPANVLNQQLSFTPVGILRAMTKSGRAEFDLITSEQRNRELIKGILGTTMMTMSMYPLIAEFLLGERDDEDKEKFSFKVHGPGPKNYDMRVLMESQGWMPYSVELTINGKTTFMPYQQSPFALPLTIAGTLKDTFASGNFSQKEYSDIAWHVAAKAMASVSDRSFLSGLGDAFEILSGDDRAGKKLERLFIRSTNPMPNFVPEIAGWVDGLLGDKDELKYKPTDFGSEYIKNLPVVRDMYGLKPDLDVFGRPIKNTSSSPFSLIASEKTPDTVVDFMVENGLSIKKPDVTTKINGELATEDQLRRIVELSGPKIYKSIQFSIPSLRMYQDKDLMQKHINAIRTNFIDEAKYQVYLESK
jgi:DNA-cytosine methyltransferase